MTKIENELKELYDCFFLNMRIEPTSGKVADSNMRFTGYPYVGQNYSKAPIKLLFVSLDVGADECGDSDTFHSFKDRQDIFPEGQLDFNPHIAGIYATTLFIMKNEMGWTRAWDALWSQRDTHKNAKAIRMSYDFLPKDLMSYIAYDNRFHFVTINRGRRTGGKDRHYLNATIEGQLLLDEIEILSPDVIVFQGKDGLWNCHIEELRKTHRVVVAYHPSCYQYHADKLQYIVESIAPQLL